MMIKYCEPCQCNNTRKLDKCPHQMIPIKIEGKSWSQIGKDILRISGIFKSKNEEIHKIFILIVK